jgi:hypothetical protein
MIVLKVTYEYVEKIYKEMRTSKWIQDSFVMSRRIKIYLIKILRNKKIKTKKTKNKNKTKGKIHIQGAEIWIYIATISL